MREIGEEKEDKKDSLTIKRQCVQSKQPIHAYFNLADTHRIENIVCLQSLVSLAYKPEPCLYCLKLQITHTSAKPGLKAIW